MSPSGLKSKIDVEQLYRVQVQELLDYAIFLIDTEGVIVSWNAGVRYVLQYEPEDFIGRPLGDLFTPEDRAAGIPEKEMATATEQGRSTDVRWHVRKDGSLLFVDGVMNALRDEQGRLLGLSKVMRDATRRHEAEVALRNSEEFARSIVESSPDCVKVLDLDGRVQMINRACCRAMDLSDLESCRDRPWPEFWEGDGKAAAERAIDAARQGAQGSFEAFCSSAGGERKCWEVIVTPIPDAQGKPARLLSISREITERRHAEAVLQRSHDELAEFAHVVSHDLQAPLRTMKSYAQLLARRYKGKLDEDADTFLSFILEASQNMEELIHGLLQYAQFGEEETRKTLSLKSVLDTVLTALQAQIEETGATVTAGELPTLEVNPTRIQQVFQNLIGNALKYRSSAEPRILIGASRSDGFWVISVSDNGVGIAPQYYDRIFLPLRRLHGKEIAGTGLGLSVCKRIVERNGGRIWVESRPGEGSTFYFTIPITAR